VQYSKERVEIPTEELTLVGNYFDGGQQAIILAHQLGREKSSYDELGPRLVAEGYTALALDFRGHGESKGRAREDADFVAMLHDIEGVARFLQQKGKKVAAVIGASIGANTVFRYSSNHNTPAILLSPGLNYKGIDINDITSRAATLLITARQDEYSLQSSTELNENNLFGTHTLLVEEGEVHGTDLLPKVTDQIIRFLETNI